MQAKLVSLQCCGEIYSEDFMLDCYGADVCVCGQYYLTSKEADINLYFK